jgi:hypothetical protein
MEAVKTLGYGAVKARGLRLSGQGVLGRQCTALEVVGNLYGGSGQVSREPMGALCRRGSATARLTARHGRPVKNQQLPAVDAVAGNPVRDDSR